MIASNECHCCNSHIIKASQASESIARWRAVLRKLAPFVSRTGSKTNGASCVAVLLSTKDRKVRSAPMPLAVLPSLRKDGC